MSEVTNQLVEGVKEMARKPLSLGAGVLLTTALAVSLVFHERLDEGGQHDGARGR